MIKTIKTIFSINVILITLIGYSQETVNGSDVNSFIIGGGQEFTDASLTIQALSLLDVSPEGSAVIADGASTLLEAGLPIFAGGTSDFIPEIWLNYTYRPINPKDESEIFVRTNMPIPDGIKIKAEIIDKSPSGNFLDRRENRTIDLRDTNRRIVRSFEAGYTEDGTMVGYKIEYTYTNDGSNELPTGFAIIYEMLQK